MSYEAVGWGVRGQGGRVFRPAQRSRRARTRGPMMGLGTGTTADPSRIVGFYLVPGMIGLLSLWVVAKIFGVKGS